MPSKVSKEKTKKTKETISIPVIDRQGKKVEDFVLPKEIFDVHLADDLLVQAIRVHLTNKRQGTVKTKTRSEVSGGGRKPWRQKGTGRARHGSIRSPIWVGGGIAHGPKPKDYQIKLPKKMKEKALFTALTRKREQGNIQAIVDLKKIKPKTKEISEMVKNLKLDDKKIILVLPNKIDEVEKASRNIPNVKTLKVEQLSTYQILNADMILFMKESIEVLKDKWLKNN